MLCHVFVDLSKEVRKNMEDLLKFCLFGMYFRPDLQLVDEIKLDEDSEAETNMLLWQLRDPSEMVMIKPPMVFQVDEPALPFAAAPRFMRFFF